MSNIMPLIASNIRAVKSSTLPVAMVQFERGSGGSVAVVGRDRRRRLPGGVTGDRGAGGATSERTFLL
jgi:hypothetical protein